MKVENHSLGTWIETDSFQILLGNGNASISNLQSSFVPTNFRRIRQVHGDRVVHTSPHTIDFSHEADAHYTCDKGVGLCIATADCIPVFLYCHNPQWVVGIHAGWRGVEKRIVPKAIATLRRINCAPEEISVFVGPHIQKPSFEVGNDVRDQLLRSFSGDSPDLYNEVSAEKSKVDLHQILKLQLIESGIEMDKCFFELKDTVTDSSYHSFRRDRENSGRQLSFITLKK
jgi:hypothetical protein